VHLTIRHATVYRYARPVSFGDHRLMFRPRDSHDLRLLSTGLEIVPAASVRWYHDIFGNSIAIASFEAEAAELRFVSTIELEHFPASEPEVAIEAYARAYPFSYSAEDIPDLGRTVERHYPDPEHRVDVWAREFVTRNGETGTLEMLVAMTKAIQAGFTYARRREEGTQPPVETLAKGAGTCRDFALLMMEAVRSLGFAARFVTGYLYDPSAKAVGGGETHAWVQIYLPGAGWVEFDPTNGIVGGTSLIRVAVTRDPSQAVPLAGSFTGAPADYLGMTVDVAIAQAA
jgi:transglutaminase-like putative cysteine protease